MDKSRGGEFKETSYELFILALSLLSIFNWFMYLVGLDPDVVQVVVAIDVLLSVSFMLDFLYRLKTASSRRDYVFRQYGWLDLLSGLPIPGLRIARLGRVVRATALMREYGL